MRELSRFITIEGIDGSGKSTFLPKIEKMLKDHGENVILTREPGGTPLSEEIRDLILNRNMDEITQLLLAFGARNEHIKKNIQPALDEGSFVLCDRFTDSTYAYQVSAGGVPFEYAEVLEHMVQKTLKPALTIIFSVPTEVSRERLNKTGKEPDQFESKDSEYFQKCIQGYEEAAARDPERCKIVDSSKGIEFTEKQVTEIMSEFFEKLKLQDNKKNKLKKTM